MVGQTVVVSLQKVNELVGAAEVDVDVAVGRHLTENLIFVQKNPSDKHLLRQLVRAAVEQSRYEY